MWILVVPWLAVALLGAGALAGSGYLILRGPFLGGAPLSGEFLIYALIVFFAGLFAFTYGGTKTARLVLGY